MLEYFDFWQLLAGLGLFLFGMRQLESSLKILAGKGFKFFLRRFTQRPVMSVFSGIITTVFVQSSSLVGLIVLALVGAGVIPLMNAIGVVIGSNLGTTITGWIVATLGFKLDLASATQPILGVSGLGMAIFKGRMHIFSQLLFAFAMLLMGLGFMKDSVGALSSLLDIKMLSGYPTIVFLIVGVIFTVIIQSSSATMMLTLSAIHAEIIPLSAAAALVIGADLGTTSTVLIGSLEGSVAKRRVAMAHILFNLTVDVVAFLALFQLLELIEWLSVSDPLYALVAFHSIFNFFGILCFLPFMKRFTRFLESSIPDNRQFISQYVTDVPSNITDVALEALGKECLYLIHMVAYLNLRFLSLNPTALFSGGKIHHYSSLDKMLNCELLNHYEAIKALEGKIVNYSLEIQTEAIDKQIAGTIELLLDSIRHAVYSSKCLKDINKDIVSFADHENLVIKDKIDVQKNQIYILYQKIFALLENREQTDYFTEEMATILKEIDQASENNIQEIYTEAIKANFNNAELSTLLNMNKEIHSSCKAFYDAVNRYCIRISIQNF